jgi:uncharacterized protein
MRRPAITQSDGCIAFTLQPFHALFSSTQIPISSILILLLFIETMMLIHRPDNAVPSPDSIAQLLREATTIAVVGLSSNPMRPSHEVAAYLQSVGYRIIPINPNEKEVLGQKAYARLEDVRESIDIVDVFRRPEDVLPVANSAIAVRAKALWLQQDITHPVAAEKARAAGLLVVEDACLFVEHKKRRLL